jgi:hypothetical protein
MKFRTDWIRQGTFSGLIFPDLLLLTIETDFKTTYNGSYRNLVAHTVSAYGRHITVPLKKPLEYLRAFNFLWTRRDSNPRPNMVQDTLSTCLSAIQLSGKGRLAAHLYRSPYVLFLVRLSHLSQTSFVFRCPYCRFNKTEHRRDKSYANSKLGS